MKKLIKYLKDCRLEMKKVAWPATDKVVSYTGLVLITTAFFAILLGLVDFVFFKVVELIF
jgi:preprotein translocase subunit SecE